MNQIARKISVIMGSLVFGAVSFAIGVKALELIWIHIVVGDPKLTSLGDGVMVIGGGFLIGCAAGVSGLILFLARFWPRQVST